MSCEHNQCGCGTEPAESAVKTTEVPHAKVMTARSSASIVLLVQEESTAPGLEQFHEPRDYRAAFLDAESARKVAAELIAFADEIQGAPSSPSS